MLEPATGQCLDSPSPSSEQSCFLRQRKSQRDNLTVRFPFSQCPGGLGLSGPSLLLPVVAPATTGNLELALSRIIAQLFHRTYTTY